MRWTKHKKNDLLEMIDNGKCCAEDVIMKFGFSYEEIQEMREKKHIFGDKGLMVSKCQKSKGIRSKAGRNKRLTIWRKK